ncbi:MAG: DUF4342 domain-containing protein [Chloroflexota bacterium]
MTEDQNTTNTEEKNKNEESNTWIDEIEVAGRDAVGRVQDLIAEGNVRRLIIMTEEERVLLEIPLTVGVALGVGTVALSAPLAAVGAIAAFLAKIKIRVVREEPSDKTKNDDDTTDA